MKRKIWDFIKMKKRERIIIITTHHMEEAEYLADRIAIMYLGKLKCSGTPFFLKNK
jgi:ABC-type multidrug transport system ATPase subunit